MRLIPARLTVRRLMGGVGLAALMLAAFRPTPDVESQQEAIRIAAIHASRADSAFLPEEHTAKAYRVCGMSPWYVDFYPAHGVFVVLRVAVSTKGRYLGSTAFGEDEGVESLRESPPMYYLDKDGNAATVVIPPTRSSSIPAP
ncbi:MAG: hypothetical protein ABS79_03230 [Planctomycetes bacterium SCN 63-9]|nr:MAG: hypothetical protein ABS79_03230 [Planctomycetes bacterium SCN 63-9]